MKLKDVLKKDGYKHNPYLGCSFIFVNKIEMDKLLYGVCYLYYDKPNLTKRIIRFIANKPIYLKIIPPNNIRILERKKNTCVDTYYLSSY